MEFSNRIPPHSSDAEASLLSCFLLDNETLVQLGDQLSADMFYREAHRKIFTAIQNLHRQGQPIDLVILMEELRSRKQLDEIGGVSYLAGLADTMPTAVFAEAYLRIVQEKYTLRQLIQAAGQTLQLAYTADQPLEDILDQSQKLVFEVGQLKNSEEFQPIRKVIHETFEHITELHKTGGVGSGIPSGFKDLDTQITGLQPGSLNVLAARPSMGKTALALSIAQNVALRAGKVVAIFSLEMPAVQLVLRMLSSEARLDMARVRSGQLLERDFDRLTDAAARLSDAKMVIDDESDLTIHSLRNKCRRIVKTYQEIGLVVIDYLQLMSGSKSNKGGGENRQQEISTISRGLKGLARELDVPVLVLSQLSRAVESRPNHRPMLSDLRESGAIEQDADIVMFIYRDEYYNKESDQQGIAEVIIGKQRNGPVGTVKLQFNSAQATFNNLASDHS